MLKYLALNSYLYIFECKEKMDVPGYREELVFNKLTFKRNKNLRKSIDFC
jgi:hypothetical protein